MHPTASMDLSGPALAAEANRCVACGLCLPHCPTYLKTESEADSPRGRVMMMRGLFEGALSPTVGLLTHLDRCLVCRSCEAVCPSSVEYGRLIDGARAQLTGGGHRASGIAGWLPGVLTLPLLLEPIGHLRFRRHYSAQGRRRGSVALFLGCLARIADARTLRAAIFLLTRLGYEVQVPRAQACCGAMHQHDGDPTRAETLAQTNLAAFAAAAPDGSGHPEKQLDMPIVFAASGCGTSLVEYGRYGAPGEAFARRAVDVVGFLAQAEGWESLDPKPLDARLFVHEPCSTRNVLRNGADTYRLLKRIPQVELEALPGNEQCCGAAGLYFLKQPEMAARLRADKMQAMRTSGAVHVVSSNYGCAHWLRKGLRQEGLDAEVTHPVLLLAKQLGFNGTC
jgi:glycolate oxidase iron-sulfur subunit